MYDDIRRNAAGIYTWWLCCCWYSFGLIERLDRQPLNFSYIISLFSPRMGLSFRMQRSYQRRNYKYYHGLGENHHKYCGRNLPESLFSSASHRHGKLSEQFRQHRTKPKSWIQHLSTAVLFGFASIIAHSISEDISSYLYLANTNKNKNWWFLLSFCHDLHHYLRFLCFAVHYFYYTCFFVYGCFCGFEKAYYIIIYEYTRTLWSTSDFFHIFPHLSFRFMYIV